MRNFIQEKLHIGNYKAGDLILVAGDCNVNGAV
jgi:hypothetical protein